MTMNNDSEFRREIAERTRPHTERLQTFKNQRIVPVHNFVIVQMHNLIDLIGYASDSTIDEYQNALFPFIDELDEVEEMLACGYDDELFSDPTSAEYRSFATEVEESRAVFNHLTDEEKQFLRNQSDMWGLLENDDERPFEEKLIELFNNQMTILEGLTK